MDGQAGRQTGPQAVKETLQDVLANAYVNTHRQALSRAHIFWIEGAVLNQGIRAPKCVSVCGEERDAFQQM